MSDKSEFCIIGEYNDKLIGNIHDNDRYVLEILCHTVYQDEIWKEESFYLNKSQMKTVIDALTEAYNQIEE